MSVSAKDVTDAALKLICHVNDMGAIDRNRESRFYGVAPAYLTVLQYELAEFEGAPPPLPISALSQNIGLSDETALKVMPEGLAMYFALIDRDAALYNHFSQSYYGTLIPAIKVAETRLHECYIRRGDPLFR
jgi:hypothetical protein